VNPAVDRYLLDGCMRCKYGATLQCKVNKWRMELEALRQVVLDTGLKEEIKWSFPCYTSGNRNIVMISAFKDYACLSFFNGALLKDRHNILEKQGANSQAGRIIKFYNTVQILQQAEIIESYIAEVVEIEKRDKKARINKQPINIPVELKQYFNIDSDFKKAFYALTPGRQRGYAIYFSEPKQSATRTRRIEKNMERIMKGVGLHDR
jgi:uncharacterized protein YdeI (YjbR/CyaY-like superfamily)